VAGVEPQSSRRRLPLPLAPHRRLSLLDLGMVTARRVMQIPLRRPVLASRPQVLDVAGVEVVVVECESQPARRCPPPHPPPHRLLVAVKDAAVSLGVLGAPASEPRHLLRLRSQRALARQPSLQQLPLGGLPQSTAPAALRPAAARRCTRSDSGLTTSVERSATWSMRWRWLNDAASTFCSFVRPI